MGKLKARSAWVGRVLVWGFIGRGRGADLGCCSWSGGGGSAGSATMAGADAASARLATVAGGCARGGERLWREAIHLCIGRRFRGWNRSGCGRRSSTDAREYWLVVRMIARGGLASLTGFELSWYGGTGERERLSRCGEAGDGLIAGGGEGGAMKFCLRWMPR